MKLTIFKTFLNFRVGLYLLHSYKHFFGSGQDVVLMTSCQEIHTQNLPSFKLATLPLPIPHHCNYYWLLVDIPSFISMVSLHYVLETCQFFTLFLHVFQPQNGSNSTLLSENLQNHKNHPFSLRKLHEQKQTTKDFNYLQRSLEQKTSSLKDNQYNKIINRNINIFEKQ